MFTAVKNRREYDAVVADFPQLSLAENLEATAVGKNGALPRHELVEPSSIFDNVHPRTEIKVVSVTQNDISTYLFQISW